MTFEEESVIHRDAASGAARLIRDLPRRIFVRFLTELRRALLAVLSNRPLQSFDVRLGKDIAIHSLLRSEDRVLKSQESFDLQVLIEEFFRDRWELRIVRNH